MNLAPTNTEADAPGLRRSWCRIDTGALQRNLQVLRHLVGPDKLLAPCVKGNAYGHGMVLTARALEEAGADWFSVDSLHEAWDLRQAGVQIPLLVLGHIPTEQASTAVELGCRVVVYSTELVDALGRASVTRAAAGHPNTSVPLHVKVETGTHRQGLEPDEAEALCQHIDRTEGVHLEGIATHFANVEDTTDHTFARGQLAEFQAFSRSLANQGIRVPIRSIANSAATILWPEAHFELVRPGIAIYGLWPSRETFLSAMLAGRDQITLEPTLTWLTRIAQVKTVPEGGMIGYGCTYRATHPTRIAILPVGYYDGYDRGLSGLAHVLIKGKRAPTRGRVCMNMVMVDVTDVDDPQVGDEVVLLGRQGDEEISAETLADWAGTINYEITTRIHEALPRVPDTSSVEEA